MIEFAVDANAATLKLRGLEARLRETAADAVRQNTQSLVNAARERLASQTRNAGTGALALSLQQSVADVGDGTTGRVFTDPSIAYARIREYGGRIAVPEIVARAAKVLAFVCKGKLVFAERVRAHDVSVPARPFMQPALGDVAPSFQADLQSAVAAAIS